MVCRPTGWFCCLTKKSLKTSLSIFAKSDISSRWGFKSFNMFIDKSFGVRQTLSVKGTSSGTFGILNSETRPEIISWFKGSSWILRFSITRAKVLFLDFVLASRKPRTKFGHTFPSDFISNERLNLKKIFHGVKKGSSKKLVQGIHGLCLSLVFYEPNSASWIPD